jgi:type VI secretion system protein ImpJ
MPAENILTGFAPHVKIGPIERIRDLVNLQLPGIGLRALPVAPRQLPFHAGFTYFELDRGNELWKQFASSAGMALHVAGEFPGLAMEFWAIRR